MPKIGHLCFPIAFFGHFQYTLTDQERIPHSPSGGDFHGKSSMGNTICPPPGDENHRWLTGFSRKSSMGNTICPPPGDENHRWLTGFSRKRSMGNGLPSTQG
ncbi:hypothetical protein GS458_3328 [Geobacillus stearothermophilus]|nr:hypothetical protein GS458_3328 [Geobacillus stearothermophilus]